MRRLLAVALAVGLATAACTKDETTTAEGGGGPAGTTPATAAPGGTAAPGTASAGPDGCEGTAIEIAGSDTGADGTLDVKMAVFDPSGTNGANIAITSYDLEVDPQFGLSIPVGEPEAPEGEVFLNISLEGLDDGPGSYPSDVTVDSSQEVNFYALYYGSERINPLEDVTVEVTAITDELICGTISPDAGSAIQDLPTVSGTFAAELIDKVEEEMAG